MGSSLGIITNKTNGEKQSTDLETIDGNWCVYREK